MSTQLTTEPRQASAELGTNRQGNIEPLPPTLSTTGSKLVYLFLRVAEEATIQELSDRLDMTMLTLYPMLGALERDGLVDRDGETFAVA